MELLIRNVADAVDTPKYQQKEMMSLDQDELLKFLEITKNSDIYSVYYPAFYVALFTGLRRSELLGLQWSDINFELAELRIIRTRHRLRDGAMALKSPKTARGRRTVALTPSTVTMLREHLEHQKATHNETVKGSDYVFTDLVGSPLMPDTVTQAWRKVANSAGLKGIRLHDARHSHASLMLQQGIHPKIVSERLGHSAVMITLDTYSHVLPGLQQAAAMKFDENLQSNQPLQESQSVPAYLS